MLNKQSFILLLFCILLSGKLEAISFLSFDARTMSLGGSGVASAKASESSIFNPSLLANHHEEKRSFYKIHAGARLLDREHFIEKAESLDDSDAENTIDNSLTQLYEDFEKQETKPDEIRDVTDDIRGFLNDLQGLSNKPLRASASVGLATGLQSRKINFALSKNRYFVIGGKVNIDQRDTLRIKQMLNTFDAIAGVMESGDDFNALVKNSGYDEVQALIEQDAQAETVSDELQSYDNIPKVNRVIEAINNLEYDTLVLNQYLDLEGFYQAILAQNASVNSNGEDYPDVRIQDYFRYQVPDNFHSQLVFSGAEISESQLSIAKRFSGKNNLSAGISIKYQDIDAIGFNQALDEVDFSAYSLDQNRNNYQRVNLDLGLSLAMNPQWTAGLMIKNIIPYKLRAPNEDIIELKPIARSAIAYQNKDFLWMLDLDLTRNEPLGFDPDKRYLTTGLEWRITKANALRTGCRLNLVDQSIMPSLGAGFGFKKAYIDIAFTASDLETELGLAMQFGLNL